jgi:tryptophan synthase alpha chain
MMATRIEKTLTNRSRKLLLPFFTAGYPNLTTFRRLASIAADSGVDIIEIGVPFSDPMADGPAIQYSSYQALKKGVTVDGVFRQVEILRRSIDLPIILMGYVNPLVAIGIDRFCRDASQSGVDGLIIPDLPVEESAVVRGAMEAHSLSYIPLVAPTSTKPRIKAIDSAASNFVYAVTVTGVTGARALPHRATDRYLAGLRKSLRHPFVAGFGVSSAESAARLCRQADGVVIGSKLVTLIREAKNSQAARNSVRRFLQSVRKAL